MKCVTQTTRCTWQVTFDDVTARDVALCSGLDVSSRHYEFSLITVIMTGRLAPAFVEVNMPYKMPDNAVRSLLTSLRIFKVVNPKGFIPPSFQIGRYRLSVFVRYAGQPPRCYRCGSEEHQIRNCPKPQSYQRCYVCGSVASESQTVTLICKTANDSLGALQSNRAAFEVVAMERKDLSEC